MSYKQYIFKSQWHDAEIPNVSLAEHAFKDISKNPDKLAFVDAYNTSRSYTFTQVKILSYRLAQGLQSAGLKPKDAVCVWAPNVIEYPIIWFGIVLAGGIMSPANPTYSTDEITHQAKDSNSKFMITIQPLADKALEACKSANIPSERLFVLGGSVPNTTPFENLLKNEGNSVVTYTVSAADDVMCIPYSSGTTGLPKGVMLTHRNCISNLCMLDALDKTIWTSDSKLVGVLPFFHIYGLIVVLLSGFTRGNTVYVHPKFDLEKLLNNIQDAKLTTLHIVPPIVLLLAKHPLVSKFDLSSVTSVMCGAAPLGAEISATFKTRLPHVVIRQGYGMTELSPVSHFQMDTRVIPGSIGPLLSNQECMIVDPKTKKSLPPSQVGELWIRGPNVMKGYWNRPDATRETIMPGGWLRTGDLGYIDNHGDYWIVDRLKELIKYKGFQVPPAELEALLLSHAEIADCAVIGLPDEEAGELPKAYVVLKAGSTLTPAQVADFVASKSAPHKRLRGGVDIVDSIPKSASGKILRRVLKDAAIKQRAKL